MKEHVRRFRSPALGNERQIWIAAPTSSTPDRLVVFLDAELYREKVGAPQIVAELNGTLPLAAYVYVSAGSADDRWRECPCYPPFATFVVDELLPWLGREFPEVAAARHRVVTGLSYTGLAAAFVAWQKPGAFDCVISQSGSFWSENCRLADAYAGLAAPLPTRFYLDVGTREVQVNLHHHEHVVQRISQIEGVQRFRSALRASGHAVEFVEFDGGHSCDEWRKTLPGALKWALGS